jgi:hypothetical protein
MSGRLHGEAQRRDGVAILGILRLTGDVATRLRRGDELAREGEAVGHGSVTLGPVQVTKLHQNGVAALVYA